MPCNCVEAWFGASFNDRASVLDEFSPNCGCENHTLRRGGGSRVEDEEVIARVLTSPGQYNAETNELIAAKLLTAYQAGLSLVRENASADEIKNTVAQLTGGVDDSKLVGASIVKAGQIRELADEARWFCVYDTENGDKEHHAELLATRPKAASKSAQRKAESDRRKALKSLFEKHFHPATTVDELVDKIRGYRGLLEVEDDV